MGHYTLILYISFVVIDINHHMKGPLTVSLHIYPFFDKLLQLPQAANAELFGAF